MNATRQLAIGALALALHTLAPAQIAIGKNGDYAVVLPSTVEPGVSELGPSIYALGMVNDQEGRFGVTGCERGGGKLFSATPAGGVDAVFSDWSSRGGSVGDMIARFICRAAGFNAPAAPAARKPINPQTL